MTPKLCSTRLPGLWLAAAFAAVLLGCSTDPKPAAAVMPAAYTLNGEASELRFVTTKNTNVAEVQQFKRLSGELSPTGKVKFTIDLASVETLIPLRNERMQGILFEVARFPNAVFEGTLDPALIKGLDVGGSADFDLAGKLSLHGQTQDTSAALRVVRLKGDRLLVSTRSPILVSAAKFELSPGLEKLREMMALPNIVGTVPVSFSLQFQKQS